MIRCLYLRPSPTLWPWQHTLGISVQGDFWAIIGRDPSVSKSNRLHINTFRLLFINSWYILYIPPKQWAILLKSWTSTSYFSNSTGSSITNGRFSLFIAWKAGKLLEAMSSCLRANIVHENTACGTERSFLQQLSRESSRICGSYWSRIPSHCSGSTGG